MDFKTSKKLRSLSANVVALQGLVTIWSAFCVSGVISHVLAGISDGSVVCTVRITHPVPEHVGGVAATVLVVLLAAAVRDDLLLQGLVPVGVGYHTAALPLSMSGHKISSCLLSVKADLQLT